jgi:hypothetical protein
MLTVCGLTGVSAASALAVGPPEKPETTAGPVTATSAVFEGVLNPHIKATVGGYFAYSEPNGLTCAEGPTAGLEGFEGEQEVKAQAVHATVPLQPDEKYKFCLVAYNEGGAQATPGNEVSVTTPAIAPTVESESTAAVTDDGAVPAEADLEAVVNANNEEVTECHFQYGTSPTLAAPTTTTACDPATLEAHPYGQAVSLTVTGLAQGTTYYYRVSAKNATGETKGTAVEPIKHFTTPIHPETPTGLEAKPIAANTATLLGTLNAGKAGNPGTYEFIYRQSPSECQGAGEKHAPEPAAAATGAKGELASTEIKELLPHTAYTFCLLARNASGEESTLAGPESFTTLVGAPTPSELFSSEVADTSVTLHATVNPQGAATTYAFEYAPPGEGFKPVPELGGKGSGTLPEGVTGAPVEVHLQEGLLANTTYQFRVKVGNSAQSEVLSETVSFTTQNTNTTFTLPDNRAYEMVTPVQKGGALFETGSEEGGAIRAAASGDAIADIASLPTEDAPEGNADHTVSILSTRGLSGWESRTIAAPHPAPGPARENQEEYTSFSEDLSSAIVEPSAIAFEQLSPQATEPTPYLHTLLSGGNVSEPCPAPDTSASSCYAPLVSASNDTTSPFVPFGELAASGACEQTFRCGPRFRGGTPDLSHLVLSSQVPLTVTKAPIGGTAEEGLLQRPDLYEYSGGALQLLSILPGQQEGTSHLELAGREGIGGANPSEGKGNVAARHAVSADGSRVVMDDLEHTPGAEKEQRIGLYLRDVLKGETIRLDEHEPGMEESVEPEYVDANSEDTKIFFLDSAKLTADSGATHAEAFHPKEDRPDLYECEIFEEEGHDHCKLTDLTPKTEAGESAKVAGVLGTSEDGSYVYFAAGGGLGIAPAGGCFVLDGEGDNGELEDDLPAGTLCNVFVRHDGVTRFVVGLSQQDAADWLTRGLSGSLVRVSSNGEWLAFLSHRSLTGYDNTEAQHGECEGRINGTNFSETGPCSEVYLYDFSTGTLSCASCDPTGTAPTGGASVPGWPYTFGAGYEKEAFYQPRYLTDEGRLFFNSPDALVPLDVSKQSEVFEYEPQGAGTCTESTSSGSELYVPSEHGCVALISTGTAAEGSRFLEASETGGDVFFLTSEKVLPQDVDTVPDVYDAHECTTASPCIAPPPALRPCETEASCKAPPSPQPTIYGAPSSATFVGPGNQATPPPPVVPKTVTKKAVKCKKGDTKNKKGKCVKKKKHTKAKKSVRHERGRSSRSHD